MEKALLKISLCFGIATDIHGNGIIHVRGHEVCARTSCPRSIAFKKKVDDFFMTALRFMVVLRQVGRFTATKRFCGAARAVPQGAMTCTRCHFCGATSMACFAGWTAVSIVRPSLNY